MQLRHKFAVSVSLSALFILPGITMGLTDGPYTTTTPIPPTLTDWTGTLSFPKFNSGLGVLDSVTLNLSGDLSTVITVTNQAGSASSGTARTESFMTVQDAGLNLQPLNGSPPPTYVPQLDLLSPTFAYSLSPGGSTNSGIITKSGTSSDIYTLAAILAEFNGPGTILLDAGTYTQTVLANTGGNTVASQVTDADLTGTVLYTYHVPEPASLMLLSGGLLLIRRKR